MRAGYLLLLCCLFAAVGAGAQTAFVTGIDIDKTAAGVPAVGPARAPTVSTASMNVNALAKEFQDNEVRANQVWIGKRVRVNGTVNSISDPTPTSDRIMQSPPSSIARRLILTSPFPPISGLN